MYSRQAVTYDREKYFTLAQKLKKKSSAFRLGVDLSFENIEQVCVVLPHMGRSNIAVPSIYKEVHTYCNQRHNGQLTNFEKEFYFLQLK